LFCSYWGLNPRPIDGSTTVYSITECSLTTKFLRLRNSACLQNYNSNQFFCIKTRFYGLRWKSTVHTCFLMFSDLPNEKVKTCIVKKMQFFTLSFGKSENMKSVCTVDFHQKSWKSCYDAKKLTGI